MYGVAQHAGGRSRTTGLVVAGLVVAAVGYGATRDLFKYEAASVPPPMIVTMIEMFCLPGTRSRPSAPMMAPTMMAPMMVEITLHSLLAA